MGDRGKLQLETPSFFGGFIAEGKVVLSGRNSVSRAARSNPCAGVCWSLWGTAAAPALRPRQLVQLGPPAVPGRRDVPHPSLFNFQAPQSTKPLQKNGSVLGSSLQDDKPVKRLDGPLRVVSLLSPRAAGAPRWSVRVSCLVPRRCCLSVCLREHGGDVA